MNFVGIVVLALAATRARSVALAGFGLDSLAVIGASTVVSGELAGTGHERQRRALRLIRRGLRRVGRLLASAVHMEPARTVPPAAQCLGIVWTAVTALIMYSLACGKARTGRALANPVLITEGRVTAVDGLLAVAVLVGLALNAAVGWWWADAVSAYVLVYYAVREARHILSDLKTTR